LGVVGTQHWRSEASFFRTGEWGPLGHWTKPCITLLVPCGSILQEPGFSDGSQVSVVAN